MPKVFADYKSQGHNWITLATGKYYPYILKDACELYKPVLVLFGQLLKTSESSERLLIQISDIPSQWMTIKIVFLFLENQDIKGKVKLIYIDPPFATKSVFQSRTQSNAYSDLLEGSYYL